MQRETVHTSRESVSVQSLPASLPSSSGETSSTRLSATSDIDFSLGPGMLSLVQLIRIHKDPPPPLLLQFPLPVLHYPHGLHDIRPGKMKVVELSAREATSATDAFSADSSVCSDPAPSSSVERVITDNGQYFSGNANDGISTKILFDNK